MPSVQIQIPGFLGMQRDVPATALDLPGEPVKALPLFDAVNLDPSRFPEIVPRPAWQYLNPTSSTQFPLVR